MAQIITQDELLRFVALIRLTEDTNKIRADLTERIENGSLCEEGILEPVIEYEDVKRWSTKRVAEVIGPDEAQSLWDAVRPTQYRRLRIFDEHGRSVGWRPIGTVDESGGASTPDKALGRVTYIWGAGRSLHATDLDRDGDIDVLSAGGDKIAWYANMDGKGAFGPQQTITNGAMGANSVYAADLDGDGDVDVLSASFRDDTIAWYEQIQAAPRTPSRVGDIER